MMVPKQSEKMDWTRKKDKKYLSGLCQLPAEMPALNPKHTASLSLSMGTWHFQSDTWEI